MSSKRILYLFTRTPLHVGADAWSTTIIPPQRISNCRSTSDSALKLQAAATDTVPEPQWVFGSARGGRLATPLKLKVVRIDGRLRLLITAPDERTISEAKKALLSKPLPALSLPATWTLISP